MVPDEVRVGIINQFCPRCGIMQAADLVTGHFRGMQISDRSTCPHGHVLWDWEWQPVPYVPTPPKPPAKKQLSLF